jgi:hypothetical protein
MVMEYWQDLPFKRFTDIDYDCIIGESFEYAKAVLSMKNRNFKKEIYGDLNGL